MCGAHAQNCSILWLLFASGHIGFPQKDPIGHGSIYFSLSEYLPPLFFSFTILAPTMVIYILGCFKNLLDLLDPLDPLDPLLRVFYLGGIQWI